MQISDTLILYNYCNHIQLQLMDTGHINRNVYGLQVEGDTLIVIVGSSFQASFYR